jgi:hypothetical protein
MTITHNVVHKVMYGITVAVIKIIVIPPQAVFNHQNSLSPMLFSHGLCRYIGRYISWCLIIALLSLTWRNGSYPAQAGLIHLCLCPYVRYKRGLQSERVFTWRNGSFSISVL